MSFDMSKIGTYDGNYVAVAAGANSPMTLLTTEEVEIDALAAPIVGAGVGDNSLVFFVFGPNRDGDIAVHVSEALDGAYLTVPSDTGSPDNYTLGPFKWGSAPKSLAGATSFTAVVTVVGVG